MIPVPDNVLSLRHGRAWVFDYDCNGGRSFVMYNFGIHDALNEELVSDADIGPH